jgi:hypothetical protein
VLWAGLAWLRIVTALVNSLMNLQIQSNTGKPLGGRTTFGLSSGFQLHRVS